MLNDIDSLIRPLDPAPLAVVDAAAASPTAKAVRRIARRVAKRRFVRLEQRVAAVDLLRPLPAPGESVHAVMDGRFSAWSLAEAVLELLAEPVEELTISTLGFNRENLESLIEAIDSGKIRGVLLNVSDYFRHSDREIFSDIRRRLEDRGQRVAITRSHAKLLLFKTPSRAIVIETSANLRSSQNHEQFVVADDPELLEFHRGWIEDLICQES